MRWMMRSAKLLLHRQEGDVLVLRLPRAMSTSHPLIKVLSSVASLTHLVRVLGDGFFVKDSQCFEEGVKEGATSMTVLVFVSLHSGTSVRLSGDYNPISVCLDVNYWLSNGSGYLWCIDPTEVNDMFRPPKFYKLQTPFSPQARPDQQKLKIDDWLILAHPASRRCAGPGCSIARQCIRISGFTVRVSDALQPHWWRLRG